MYVFQGKINWDIDSDDHVASNETVTVVIPKSTRIGDPVHMFWQWSFFRTDDSKTNINAIFSGLIDAFLSPIQFRFHDSSQPEYRFEATLTPDLEVDEGDSFPELSIVMSNQKGFAQTLSLRNIFEWEPEVHDAYFPALPTPRIYVGKVDWYSSAVNELIVIVCPARIDAQSKVCACWQWTTTQPDKRHKVPCSIVTNYEEINNGDHGIAFTLHNANKYYTLRCEINEDDDVLDVLMSSGASDVNGKEFTLGLLDSGSNIGRSLLPESFAIQNDTDDIVLCSLRSDGPDARGRGPSITSLTPFALAPNAGFTQYEWAVNVITSAIASTGSANVQDASEPLNSQLLHREDIIFKKSYGGWLGPNDELTIARLSVGENGSALNLQVGRISSVGNGTLRLSDLFSDRSDIKMEILSTLSLPTMQKVQTLQLLAQRTFAVPCLQPDSRFPTIDIKPWGNYEAGFAITRRADGPVQGPTFYDMKGWQWFGLRRYAIFSYDPSHVFFFSLPPAHIGDVRAFQLSNGTHVLSLAGCVVRPSLQSTNIDTVGRKLGAADTLGSALLQIDKCPGAWAYSQSGNNVWAWYPSVTNSVTIEFSNRGINRVYLVVHPLNEVYSHAVVEA